MTTRAATITMTMREVDRLKTVQAVVDRMLRFSRAAQRLGMSQRQVHRLVLRYEDEGPAGMISRRCSRPSNNQLAPGVAERAITSSANAMQERANLMLQDRPVKELRLRGIDTREAANAFAPHFIADFNARLAKAPRRDFDAHRPVRADEDLDLIFTWRLQRKVSLSLTLQHERIIYLLKDTAANRRLIHHYIDVYEYPDGAHRAESRGDQSALRALRQAAAGGQRSDRGEQAPEPCAAGGHGDPDAARRPPPIQHAFAHKSGPGALLQDRPARHEAFSAVHHGRFQLGRDGRLRQQQSVKTATSEAVMRNGCAGLRLGWRGVFDLATLTEFAEVQK